VAIAAFGRVKFNAGDPDPHDPLVFGTPGTGSINLRYGSGSRSVSGSFLFLINVLSGKFFKTEHNVPVGKKKKIFCILKVNKERSRIQSWIRTQRYGSGSTPKCHESPTLVKLARLVRVRVTRPPSFTKSTISSRTKLWYTLQLRGQIPSLHISTPPLYVLCR
jgi:hypothetical protein